MSRFLSRFFSLETGSNVWPSINRIQTSTILNSAKIPAPDWILHLVIHGWPCKLPLPSMLHSLTKLRVKINLNTLKIKLGLNHRPIAPEQFQKAWRYKHTFHSEKPQGSPGTAWGSQSPALFCKIPSWLTIRHSIVEMIMIMSLCCALKLNPSEQSDEISIFISIYKPRRNSANIIDGLSRSYLANTGYNQSLSPNILITSPFSFYCFTVAAASIQPGPRSGLGRTLCRKYF